MNTKIVDIRFFDLMTTSTPGLSTEMKTFYDDLLKDYAKPNLVHNKYGQKRPIPKGKGKTIEFRRYKTLDKALTPLTEGETPKGNKLEVTAITSTVKQYGDWIAISDMLKLTAIDNNITEALVLLGNQAGATLDTVTREVINAGKNVLYAPKGETGVVRRTDLDGTALVTLPLVLKAAAILKGKNAVPMEGGYYVGIIHPYVAFDLMLDPKFEEWSKYTTPEKMYEGEIGKIGKVRFVESTEAKIWEKAAASSQVSVFSTLIVAKNAYGTTEIEGGGLETIVKQMGSSGTADPLNQRASVGWKATATAEILNDSYMVRIESASSFAAAEAN